MEIERPAAQFDIWTSINNNSTPNMDSTVIPTAATYIHPLVKRSSSSLSDESLQICTESLGSETGSDICFSSSSSEDDQLQQQQQDKADIQFPNKSYGGKLSTASKSFPPPLTSLSRADAPSIRMHSHRQNGRLVLEAVSIPSQSYFNAQRHDGRLTLTFANNPNTMEEEDGSNEYDEEEEEGQDNETLSDEEEEEVINCYDIGMMAESEMGIVASKRSPVPQIVMNNLCYKLIRPLANENPTTWLKFDEQDVQQEEDAIPHSKQTFIVMSPRMKKGTRLNVYDNCWKGKATNVGNIYMQKAPPVKNKFVISGRNEEQKAVIVKGGINDGCKDTRTSFLFWESSLNCVI